MAFKLGEFMRQLESAEQLVFTNIQSSLNVKNALLADASFHSLVASIGLSIADALRKGQKIFFFGNGGSAADAQHLAAELTGRYLIDRSSLPAIALTANTSSITAISNDYSYELVFARQLQGLSSKGDVAFGISTSGNSANVLRAFEVAAERELLTVGMTGKDGGGMKDVVDHCICVPSDDTPRIQECHILVGHIICEIIEKSLFS
jgi:D-sedoheptulose 7-phosphate isomerase